MRAFFRPFLIFLMIFSVSATAFAADEGEYDFSDMPDEYIEEVSEVYNSCQGNFTKRMYYDCECFAFEFLQKRLDAEPYESTDALVFELRYMCRDATEAAGQEYNSCLTKTNNMKPGTDPEAFCECYANNFAIMINNAIPTLQSRTISPYKIRAWVMCNDPRMARNLYGIAPR